MNQDTEVLRRLDEMQACMEKMLMLLEMLVEVDEGEERPAIDLDGRPMPAERDGSQPL